MIPRFEDLCNELLLDIFDYVDPRQLYHTFWNLNSRLNNLLTSVTGLQLLVDGEENEETIALLTPHISCLKINTWNEINLNGFYNLHSLVLTRPSPIQLKQIRADTMPKLTHLSLFSNVYFTAPKQLIDDVFLNRFSCLQWARLGYINLSDSHYRSIQSHSLLHLHISCFHTTMIPFVLASCPQLKYLHVDILQYGDKTTIPSPTVANHPLQNFILRDYCCSISNEDIHTLITFIPNTRKLELKINCKAPFISLVQNLSDSLSHLHRFNCDITESPIDNATHLTTIQQIHPCFCHIMYRTQAANFRIFAT
jgi:hypothetical protein